MSWIKDIINQAQSWAELKRFLTVGAVTVSTAVVLAVVVGKKVAAVTIEKNTEEVSLNNTLNQFSYSQDSFRLCLVDIKQNIFTLREEFDTFYSEEEEKLEDLTNELTRTNQNLRFAVEQVDSMTARQIIKAFELGKGTRTLPLRYYHQGEPDFTPLDTLLANARPWHSPLKIEDNAY